MIVTVLWEDQQGVQTKGFGPHELLLSAVADELTRSVADDLGRHAQLRSMLTRHVSCVPKKGNGNVLRALQKDLPRMHGPVVAVLDRDKAHELCQHAAPAPANCMQGISQRLRDHAPGTYDLVFLIHNTETLIAAACAAHTEPAPARKPKPDERDRLLGRAAWASRSIREAIRQACPSFDRLAKRVALHAQKLELR